MRKAALAPSRELSLALGRRIGPGGAAASPVKRGQLPPCGFAWLLLIKPASGSSARLLGAAMPSLPPTAQGIAGVSGMPPQSRSWPASAPSWKSTAVFNYRPPRGL